MWIIHYRNFGEELGLQDQVPSIINGGPRKWIFTIVLEGLFQVGPIYEWINRHGRLRVPILDLVESKPPHARGGSGSIPV